MNLKDAVTQIAKATGDDVSPVKIRFLAMKEPYTARDGLFVWTHPHPPHKVYRICPADQDVEGLLTTAKAIAERFNPDFIAQLHRICDEVNSDMQTALMESAICTVEQFTAQLTKFDIPYRIVPGETRDQDKVVMNNDRQTLAQYNWAFSSESDGPGWQEGTWSFSDTEMFWTREKAIEYYMARDAKKAAHHSVKDARARRDY